MSKIPWENVFSLTWMDGVKLLVKPFGAELLAQTVQEILRDASQPRRPEQHSRRQQDRIAGKA